MPYKPSSNHPWKRNLRHDGLESYNNLSQDRYKEMINDVISLIDDLKSDDKLLVVGGNKLTRPYSRTMEETISIGIKDKVFMRDRFLAYIAEKLKIALQNHHWKFKRSLERSYCITYYLVPDWKYWIFSK